MKSCRSFWAFHILKFPYCIVTVWNLDAWRTVWPAMKSTSNNHMVPLDSAWLLHALVGQYPRTDIFSFLSRALWRPMKLWLGPAVDAGRTCGISLLCSAQSLPCTRVQSCSFLFRTARLTWTFEIAWMMLISCCVKNRQVMLKEEGALYSSSSGLSSFSDSLE